MIVEKMETQEDRPPLSYFCTPQYLEHFLGNFEIHDRPKRAIGRFLDNELNPATYISEHDKTISKTNQDQSPRDIIMRDYYMPRSKISFKYIKITNGTCPFLRKRYRDIEISISSFEK